MMIGEPKDVFYSLIMENCVRDEELTTLLESKISTFFYSFYFLFFLIYNLDVCGCF